MTDDTSLPAHSPWLRRITYTLAAVMIFFTGWGQGELAATQRLAGALHHVSPSVVERVRDACPRDLDQRGGWNQNCFDLLPLIYLLSNQ